MRTRENALILTVMRDLTSKAVAFEVGMIKTNMLLFARLPAETQVPFGAAEWNRWPGSMKR